MMTDCRRDNCSDSGGAGIPTKATRARPLRVNLIWRQIRYIEAIRRGGARWDVVDVLRVGLRFEAAGPCPGRVERFQVFEDIEAAGEAGCGSAGERFPMPGRTALPVVQLAWPLDVSLEESEIRPENGTIDILTLPVKVPLN